MTRKVDYEYKCFNDCRQEGCPGHKMQLIYETVSDMVTLVTLGHKDKNGEWTNSKTEVFDRNELNALGMAWQELWNKI